MARFALWRRTFEIKRSCAVKCFNPDPLLQGSDLHAPVAGVGQGVEVAIIHKCFHFYFEGRASTEERVGNKSSVFALAHPNALLQQRIG